MPIPPTPARRPRRGALPAAAIVATLALSAAGLTARSSPALAADTATINGATTYQTIAGFGASEGFGEAATVMNASPSVQQQALSLLYSPTSGAGLTILRNEISADSGIDHRADQPRQPHRDPDLRPRSPRSAATRASCGSPSRSRRTTG